MDVKAVGQFLKERRKLMGLTQSHVAERIGVSAQAVSKWERGENLPDAAFFVELSQILGMTVEGLLSGGVSEAADGDAKQNVDDKAFARLLDDLSKLGHVEEIDIDLDFFVYLTSRQKMDFIKTLLGMSGFGLVLDEILPYAAGLHKQAILAHVLKSRAYDELEQLLPFISNEMKAVTLAKLLSEARLDIVEDYITTFNRRHRDMIVEYFVNTRNRDDIDNFVPFFDKNQLNRLYYSPTKNVDD